MKIKKTFLKLTKQTYPHGTEYELFDRLYDRVPDLQQDDFGNLFLEIGDGSSDVMFASHLDTATSAYTKVNHVIEDNIIKTDGKSILGADDKAGVTIMLYMIKHNIPGLYYFFLGEEVGCLGSRDVAGKHKEEKLAHINKVISFDRRGLDSVITYQSSTRCCSDAFATALGEQLNMVENSFKYKNDPTGVYTDSAVFTKIYPECTNLSVGYYSEHTMSERQDIEHLEKLAKACLLVDWTSLPVERDPEKVEYQSYSGYGGYGWGYDDDYSEYLTNRNNRISSNKTATSGNTGSSKWDYYRESDKADQKKIPFWDEDFNYIGSYTIDKKTLEYVKVNLDPKRIRKEYESIASFLTDIDVEFKTIKWDGVKLRVYNGNGTSVEDITRNELIEYLGELDLIKLKGDNKLASVYGYYDN